MSVSALWTIPSSKIKELDNLILMYDTAIARQEGLLEKVVKGKFLSTKLSDRVLYALVKGDLNLLKEKRKEILADLNNLKKLNDEDKTANGYHTARSDTGSES